MLLNVYSFIHSYHYVEQLGKFQDSLPKTSAADLQKSFFKIDKTRSAAAEDGCRSKTLAVVSFQVGMLLAYCFQNSIASKSPEMCLQQQLHTEEILV